MTLLSSWTFCVVSQSGVRKVARKPHTAWEVNNDYEQQHSHHTSTLFLRSSKNTGLVLVVEAGSCTLETRSGEFGSIKWGDLRLLFGAAPDWGW